MANMTIENSNSTCLNQLSLLVADHLPAKLAYWDKNLICRFVNKACNEWFGKTREQMIGKMHLRELLGRRIFEQNFPHVKEVLFGRQQMFERDTPVPGDKTVRHSLVTYIPHFEHSEVVGFFVEVSDITYVKNLEREIIRAKREMLRNTILTTEKERRHIVELLHESINQRLAVCNWMISNIKRNPNSVGDVQSYILEVIKELNLVCQDLTPTEIETFGIISAIEMLLEQHCASHPKKLQLECKDESLEEIALNDKLSIYRIVQSFVKLVLMSGGNNKAKIVITYHKPEIHIRLLSNIGIHLDVETKEYRTIVYRVEYFAGEMIQTKLSNRNCLDIKFSILND